MNRVIKYGKKRYYSDDEKQAIVDRFLNSGLTKSTFCKHENISASALYRWQKELYSTGKIKSAFIPVQAGVELKSENNYLRLKIDNMVELLIPVGFDTSYVAKVIKELTR